MGRKASKKFKEILLQKYENGEYLTKNECNVIGITKEEMFDKRKSMLFRNRNRQRQVFKFADLPSDRVVTDDIQPFAVNILNNIYSNGDQIYIRRTEDGLKNVEICSYISDKLSRSVNSEARNFACTPDDIKNGACLSCPGCGFRTFYMACIQAAEFRSRLQKFERGVRNEFLQPVLCRVGDIVYEPTWRGNINKYRVTCVRIYKDNVFYEWTCIDGYSTNTHGFDEEQIGKTVYLNEREAVTALKVLSSKKEN